MGYDLNVFQAQMMVWGNKPPSTIKVTKTLNWTRTCKAPAKTPSPRPFDVKCPPPSPASSTFRYWENDISVGSDCSSSTPSKNQPKGCLTLNTSTLNVTTLIWSPFWRSHVTYSGSWFSVDPAAEKMIVTVLNHHRMHVKYRFTRRVAVTVDPFR